MTQSTQLLRDALANIHRDTTWWRTVLGAGACMLTIVGWPLASGLVVEHMENTTKGYPTPLPPWIDLGTRYIIGIFALMIDFVLFLVPILLAGGVMICAMVATVIGASGSDSASGLFRTIALTILAVVVLIDGTLFLLGTAPVARLKYVEDGRIEEALGGKPVQQIIRSPARNVYVRARLVTLVAYVPLVVVVAVAWGLTLVSFPGQLIALLLCLWLMFSALFYAHLLVAQVYALADQEIQRAVMSARMPW